MGPVRIDPDTLVSTKKSTVDDGSVFYMLHVAMAKTSQMVVLCDGLRAEKPHMLLHALSVDHEVEMQTFRHEG